jgi:hypothetical protein
MKNYLYSLAMLLALFYFLTHCGVYSGTGGAHSVNAIPVLSVVQDTLHGTAYKLRLIR